MKLDSVCAGACKLWSTLLRSLTGIYTKCHKHFKEKRGLPIRLNGFKFNDMNANFWPIQILFSHLTEPMCREECCVSPAWFPYPSARLPELCPGTLPSTISLQSIRIRVSFISLGHLFSGTPNSRQHVNFFQLLLSLLLLNPFPLLLWNDLIPVLVRALFQLFLIFHCCEVGNLKTNGQLTFPYFPNTIY